MRMRVKITDTTFRDAHQSLWATRMRTEDMLPVAEKMDNVGFHSMEVWGGATFDVCLRFLNEDPWERLRLLKKHIRRTPLQMLLRGQSLVGYQHYPDDVVEAFIDRAVANGIDIIRIFDALNDVRNLETAMRATRKAGAHVQAAVVYTVSPVHTTGHYLETALKLAEMGADSICIKDMAGLLAPYHAYELVKLFKEKLVIPVQLHSHYIGGMAMGAYLKAAEAGVDVIDTASVPIAFGASQPPVETVARILQGSPYDAGLDLSVLFEIADYFERLRKKGGFERGVTRITDMQVFEHQVPGGMISNLVIQLEEQKALHRLPEVLAEIPRVREELGFPPLVTPTSQIVGSQAVLNVLYGERYKLVPGEVKNYVRGYYGCSPAPINDEITKKILGDCAPVLCRPADLLEPQMERMKAEIKNLAACEEDVISHALFPQVARKFFESRNNRQGGGSMTDNHGKEINKLSLQDVKELLKMINETEIAELSLESAGVKIAIRKSNAARVSEPSCLSGPVLPVEDQPAVAPLQAIGGGAEKDLIPVVAPLVGTFYQAPAPDAPPFIKVGEQVKAGQTLCIIEAMKLMNEISAPNDGEIVKVLVENGQPVEYGQVLFLIREEKQN
ncbi:MAG: acetyl-CoA carboxylase biotin carboxyl carrier protein [Peptococcaceae bacterium]|nr:MAG: acetyl-CoA carboxylase biotin carboxyl carrier protein [Peptococcaceae bacterium]